jgi:hypothetical protein
LVENYEPNLHTTHPSIHPSIHPRYAAQQMDTLGINLNVQATDSKMAPMVPKELLAQSTPQFNPEEPTIQPKEFIRVYIETANNNAWTQPITNNLIKSTMKGTAAAWVAAAYPYPISDLGQFAAAFVRKYEPTHASRVTAYVKNYKLKDEYAGFTSMVLTFQQIAATCTEVKMLMLDHIKNTLSNDNAFVAIKGKWQSLEDIGDSDVAIIEQILTNNREAKQKHEQITAIDAPRYYDNGYYPQQRGGYTSQRGGFPQRQRGGGSPQGRRGGSAGQQGAALGDSSFDENKYCNFHGRTGHDIEECSGYKRFKKRMASSGATDFRQGER